MRLDPNGHSYAERMVETKTVVVGAEGRLVVPAELCERVGLAEGTSLVLLDSPNGLVLLTQQQLRDRLRSELQGVVLLEALLRERRAAAAEEDAA